MKEEKKERNNGRNKTPVREQWQQQQQQQQVDVVSLILFFFPRHGTTLKRGEEKGHDFPVCAQHSLCLWLSSFNTFSYLVSERKKIDVHRGRAVAEEQRRRRKKAVDGKGINKMNKDPTCLRSIVMVTHSNRRPFWRVGDCHRLLVPSMALLIGWRWSSSLSSQTLRLFKFILTIN